jgi:hypothetical protein
VVVALGAPGVPVTCWAFRVFVCSASPEQAASKLVANNKLLDGPNVRVSLVMTTSLLV